ncbi:melatonin-related receptor-like [Branchiostoma lanceolatum]|uniref:melatonin-related receptor-like n=1 Tax=Branchiostoma lanceolatum TaxID=7740 RepID=UPI003453D067
MISTSSTLLSTTSVTTEMRRARNDTVSAGNITDFTVADGFETAFAVSVGTVGPVASILVILATVKTRNLRTPSNAIVATQCTTDLLAAICIGPAQTVGIITGGWPLDPAACTAIGLVQLVCVVMSNITLTHIAINRCVIITKNINTYDTIFNWKTTTLFLVASAIASFILVLSFYAGGVEVGYNPITRRCIIIQDLDSAVYIAFARTWSALSVTMVIISVLAYIKIIVRVRRSGEQVQGYASNVRKRTELRLTRNCGLLFLVFFVFWLWSSITFGIIVPESKVLPVHLIRLASDLVSADTIVNPLVYGIININYRTAISNLCRCRSNAVHVGNSSNATIPGKIKVTVSSAAQSAGGPMSGTVSPGLFHQPASPMSGAVPQGQLNNRLWVVPQVQDTSC